MRYPQVFNDRAHAGRQLAHKLRDGAVKDPVVLAVPRGGVPVAVVVADALSAQLDVAVVRKLASPDDPEYAFGSVGEAGVSVINEAAVANLGLADSAVVRIRDKKVQELQRRVLHYRQGRTPIPIDGRDVIIVDDGIATGASARAAAELVKKRGANRIVMAAPVASPTAVESLQRSCAEIDEVLVVEMPADFRSVGTYYADFRQIPDEDVARQLAEHQRTRRRHITRPHPAEPALPASPASSGQASA